MTERDVMLKIVGKQIKEGEEIADSIEFVTEGKLHDEGDTVYLSYKESPLSGLEGCTTSLKIMKDRIEMRRFGEVSTLENEMEFEKGKRFQGLYETPYGSVQMEVLTNEIINKIKKEEGKGFLNIDYDMSLRGLVESRSILNIEIMDTAKS